MTISSCAFTSLLDVLEGQAMRRRVDQRANPAPSRRPGPARWETRRTSLPASSGSARRRRRHNRRRTEPGEKATSWPWNDYLQNWDKAPLGSTEKRLPRQWTVSPNSDVRNTAKLNRSRTGKSQDGPAQVPKISSMRRLRNSRAAKVTAITARPGQEKPSRTARNQRNREPVGDDAAQMAQRVDRCGWCGSSAVRDGTIRGRSIRSRYGPPPLRASPATWPRSRTARPIS